jgi:hypothetical protein
MDPIARYLAEAYFSMADRAAEKATRGFADSYWSKEADRYWQLGARCDYAGLTLYIPKEK